MNAKDMQKLSILARKRDPEKLRAQMQAMSAKGVKARAEKRAKLALDKP